MNQERESGELSGREIRVKILDETDVEDAALEAKSLAGVSGFNPIPQYMIAIAASELGTNICRYGKKGEMIIRAVQGKSGKGIEIIAADEGPGIPDVEKAMQDGFSTGESLGVGLSGVKRLMDEMEIETAPGKGTRVTARKWILKSTTT